MTGPDDRPYWKRHYGIVDGPVNAAAARRFLRAVAIALVVVTAVMLAVAALAAVL